MFEIFPSNRTDFRTLNHLEQLWDKSKFILHKFQQKAKDKSITQLITLAFLKVVDSLMMAKYRLQYQNVKFGSGVTIRGKFAVEGKGQVEIGNSCYFISKKNQANIIHVSDASSHLVIGENGFFDATHFNIFGEGKVKIGNHCYFNGTTIKAVNSVEIKNHCLISDAVLVDTDFHSIEINRRSPEAITKHKPICINENVWIASQSMILKGVTIGKNSVVGAMTVVRQSIPENVVVIGNPQQIVKKLDPTILPYTLPEERVQKVKETKTLQLTN